MGGAVGARVLHAIGQVARGQHLDALVFHRRAQAVPANAFETGTVAGRDADVSVEGETLDAGAARSMRGKVKAGTPGGLKSSGIEPLKGIVSQAPLGGIKASLVPAAKMPISTGPLLAWRDLAGLDLADAGGALPPVRSRCRGAEEREPRTDRSGRHAECRRIRRTHVGRPLDQPISVRANLWRFAATTEAHT